MYGIEVCTGQMEKGQHPEKADNEHQHLEEHKQVVEHSVIITQKAEPASVCWIGIDGFQTVPLAYEPLFHLVSALGIAQKDAEAGDEAEYYGNDDG